MLFRSVLVSALLHDIGMTVTRDSHELVGLVIALKYIDEMLAQVYDNTEIPQKIAVRSLILEGIFGHMATKKINSLEAGLVLIGDGCDMEEGRARIPNIIRSSPKAGDIHKYSAGSISKVLIEKGEEKPIRILIQMSENVGIFQVEEVLYPKILSSPVKPHIELYAQVQEQDILRYL